jgi:Protein of unknown function (DUF3618)
MTLNNRPNSTRAQVRDPREIQREADAIRADLERTLHALERKLSPRQVWDRSLQRARANGGELLQRVGETAKQHPVPFMIASAGALWLATSRRKHSKHDRDLAASIAQRRGDFDRVAQTLREVGERSTGRPFDAARANSAATGGKLNQMLRKRPTVYGTLALALGAAVGATLPPSRYERSLAVRARDAAGPLIKQAAQAIRNRAGV